MEAYLWRKRHAYRGDRCDGTELNNGFKGNVYVPGGCDGGRGSGERCWRKEEGGSQEGRERAFVHTPEASIEPFPTGDKCRSDLAIGGFTADRDGPLAAANPGASECCQGRAALLRGWDSGAPRGCEPALLAPKLTLLCSLLFSLQRLTIYHANHQSSLRSSKYLFSLER